MNLKKETTIIATVELTKHFSEIVSEPIETFKQKVKESWHNDFKKTFETADNINITHVQVFEVEKAERISTEDLIAAARLCADDHLNSCKKCLFYGEGFGMSEDCYDKLKAMLADRLEELHNQLTATPTKHEENRSCDTCKFEHFDAFEHPCSKCSCCDCWEEQRGD